MKPRLSRTSTAMERRWLAVNVLEGIDLLVGSAADAADVRAAADGIVDAAGAVEGPVAAGGIAVAAGLVGDDTRTFCHGFTRIYTDEKGHGASRGLFWRAGFVSGSND